LKTVFLIDIPLLKPNYSGTNML